MKIADRISRIQPSITLEMTAKAAELKQKGIDVINLSVGEPDFDTPQNIKDAAHKAIKQGMTKYTAGSGIPDLKEAIINKLKRDNNLEYKLNNIIVSCGGKHTLYNACQVLFQKEILSYGTWLEVIFSSVKKSAAIQKHATILILYSIQKMLI